jgi:HD superfamily phosphohydrolase
MLIDSVNYYEGKLFNDPIHGNMIFDKVSLKFIDTRQFQRLKYLKQLGMIYFVFPGASHNRFEHSLGTGHLAGALATKFKKSQPDLDITDEDVLNVRIAGLCHDLGHGPFSHCFESFVTKVTHLSFDHEEMSCKMLDFLVEENNIKDVDDSLDRIKRYITGKRYDSDDKKFLFDIVHNEINSVDVDKFDYIPRDCHMCGVPSSFNGSRLMQLASVVQDEVCYSHKEAFDLYELFHTRYSLHKRVYSHKVNCALDHMLTDMLVAADPYMRISEKLNDPKNFVIFFEYYL